jgi:hypothetical protein
MVFRKLSASLSLALVVFGAPAWGENCRPPGLCRCGSPQDVGQAQYQGCMANCALPICPLTPVPPRPNCGAEPQSTCVSYSCGANGQWQSTNTSSGAICNISGQNGLCNGAGSCVAANTVTIQGSPNNEGLPLRGSQWDTGPNGVIFTVPGAAQASPIATTYSGPGVYVFANPCPVTATLSEGLQAGNSFVDSYGTQSPTETISSCPATLFLQPFNIIDNDHGGGEIALFIFLASAFAWGWGRKVRQR